MHPLRGWPLVVPLLAALFLGSAPATRAQTPAAFQGPNLLLTRARIQELQDAHRRGDPLVVAAWQDLVAAADACLARQPDPIRGPLRVPGYYTKARATQQRLMGQLRGDARAAWTLALAHALTGRADHADQARAFVLAWVDALGEPRDGGRWWQRAIGEHRGDTPLAISYGLTPFLYAWDTLRGLGQVSAADHARFAAWLRRYVDYHRREEPFQNNHHDWQALFLAAAGHVLEDPALFDRAIGYHRRGQRCGIARDGALWRELLRKEKAATYTLMALEAKVQLVVIAERHGVSDLRDARGGRRGLLGDAIIRGAAGRLGSIPVPREGGTLREALARLREFALDPASWDVYRPLTKAPRLGGPATPGDWGWLYEVAYAWWGDPQDRAMLSGAPYGAEPPRAYTLGFATLLFRPLPRAGIVSAVGGGGSP